ncbi:hypothetical protein NFJ02_05g122340 [Pycnococcus provasolii]
MIRATNVEVPVEAGGVLYALRYAVTKSCGLLTKNIVGQDAAKALRIKFIEKLLEALDGVDYEHVQNDCRGFFGPNFELQHFCQRSKFVEVKMMPEVRAKILTATVSQLTTLNAAFKSVLSHFKPGAEDPSETLKNLLVLFVDHSAFSTPRGLSPIRDDQHLLERIKRDTTIKCTHVGKIDFATHDGALTIQNAYYSAELFGFVNILSYIVMREAGAVLVDKKADPYILLPNSDIIVNRASDVARHVQTAIEL